MIRGRIFSEMIQIQARKSELQAESRSYGPKSEIQRADPQNPKRIAQKRAPHGVQVLLQKPALRAFLNPPKIWGYFLGDNLQRLSPNPKIEK